MTENTAPQNTQAQDAARKALQAMVPDFYAAVCDFDDLHVEAGLSSAELDALEKKLDFTFAAGLRHFLGQCSAVSLAGLSVKAAELGPIVMPGSDALVIGEFYLYNPGDRLLMLDGEEAVYYLEQRNGSITKLAEDVQSFFNKTLLKYLY